MVDGNKLGDVGFQYLGVSYSVMDCQKFVETCLADCGLKKDLAGSNTWYREVMKNGWTGTPEECVNMLGCVPKGAFLFILEQDGKEPEKYKGDGIGNASHIGICTGDRGKGAIHSSYTNDCVCESEFHGKTIKNGGWNRVGLWDQVAFDYGGGSSPEPEPEKKMATVWADNGKPVNLRKKASKLAALVDRVPCNDQVEILERGDEWSRVKWHGKTGFMMSKFLFTEDTFDDLYTVIIEHVGREIAEELIAEYGGTMEKEG